MDPVTSSHEDADTAALLDDLLRVRETPAKSAAAHVRLLRRAW